MCIASWEPYCHRYVFEELGFDIFVWGIHLSDVTYKAEHDWAQNQLYKTKLSVTKKAAAALLWSLYRYIFALKLLEH